MAHYARLTETNLVVEVIAVDNSDILDDQGNEVESKGVEFLRNLFGKDSIWKQTSYNRTFRKNFAGVGYTYDEDKDAFIPPQDFPSWVLDEDTFQWKAPIPRPVDGWYDWDEATTSWVLHEPPEDQS